MAEAGFPDGQAGREWSDFNTSENHRKIAVALQQMWKDELNIEYHARNQEWKVFLEHGTEGISTFPAGLDGRHVDPSNFSQYLFTTDSGINTGFSNARYDEIMLELATQAETGRSALHFARGRDDIAWSVPVIPLYLQQ